MTILEEKRDLFSLPHGWTFAHCISADFALGAGIAVEFDTHYNMRQRLLNGFNAAPGEAIHIDNVINMVTKEKCWHKPRYEDLKAALDKTAEIVITERVSKLAMPRIGCGLDGLNWSRVKPMIESVFSGIDVEIVVCYL